MKWLPVVGYEGIYEVSEYGDVKKIIRSRSGRHPRNGIMRTNVNRNGYRCVMLTAEDGKFKTHKIHRLVAHAFIGDPDALQVNHKDCNKLNNHYSNLEYVTHSENVQHAIDNNLMKSFNGEECSSSVLTELQVVEIRRLYKSGNISQRNLAHLYGVKQFAIWSIVNRKTWRHIE